MLLFPVLSEFYTLTRTLSCWKYHYFTHGLHPNETGCSDTGTLTCIWCQFKAVSVPLNTAHSTFSGLYICTGTVWRHNPLTCLVHESTKVVLECQTRQSYWRFTVYTVKTFCSVLREEPDWSSAFNASHKSTMRYVLRIGCSTPPDIFHVHIPGASSSTTNVLTCVFCSSLSMLLRLLLLRMVASLQSCFSESL